MLSRGQVADRIRIRTTGAAAYLDRRGMCNPNPGSKLVPETSCKIKYLHTVTKIEK